MDGWSKLQSSLSNMNFAQSANKLAKGFNSGVQLTRERLGQVAPEDITELPQEYKDLEARVDALRQVHIALLQVKITKAYENETYDYPVQIQESISELSTTIGHGITNFAANNLKGTNLPVPSPVAPPAAQHKTLPHALCRAATTGANALQGAPGGNEHKLRNALGEYAGAWERIADARLQHDESIRAEYLQPWQMTLSTSIGVAMKARQAVRQTLKNAGPAKQEQARLEKTEVAITLMKTVLENPEPLKNLNELAKAQLIYFTTAAEALSSAQGAIEELSVAAEGEYRKSRDH
ncbi:hypothetical protein BKA82DRAFT_4176512 [Pisolithus tinctorius]|nr:hypothetical protein BKA82DRAFT_4176512 [Pisolithus tinctorius]